MLHQALAERVVLVVMMSKIGRVILKLKLEREEAYQKFENNMEVIIVVVASCHDNNLGELRLHQRNRNVLFGSGLHQFRFMLCCFAQMYRKRFWLGEKDLVKRLWKENFFNAKTKQRQPTNQEKEGKTVFEAIMTNKRGEEVTQAREKRERVRGEEQEGTWVREREWEAERGERNKQKSMGGRVGICGGSGVMVQMGKDRMQLRAGGKGCRFFLKCEIRSNQRLSGRRSGEWCVKRRCEGSG
jgi:hypothetical protein